MAPRGRPRKTAAAATARKGPAASAKKSAAKTTGTTAGAKNDAGIAGVVPAAVLPESGDVVSAGKREKEETKTSQVTNGEKVGRSSTSGTKRQISARIASAGKSPFANNALTAPTSLIPTKRARVAPAEGFLGGRLASAASAPASASASTFDFVAEEEYEVEAILDSRGRGRAIMYCVKWKGYPNSEATWEPISNLTHSSEMIAEYEMRTHRPAPPPPVPQPPKRTQLMPSAANSTSAASASASISTSAARSGRSDQETRSALSYMRMLGGIKTEKRTGWVLRNIPNPESVGDHQYRMAMMAMMLHSTPYAAEMEIDVSKCIQMALSHDVAESIIGDIVPGTMSKEDKLQKEDEAMVLLRNTLRGTRAGRGNSFASAARHVEDLWREYVEQETVEAKFVKDLDRFEMVLQADEYEQSAAQPLNLEEFFESVTGSFTTTIVKSWFDELVRDRSIRTSSKA